MIHTFVFGGTFDPVHVGHIESAKALIARYPGSKLVLVPSQAPPHRDKPSATGQQRLEMLNLATVDADQISVSDVEIGRSGLSFTIDTLEHFRGELGKAAPLSFVLGMDAYITLPSWHRWQELCDLANLMVLQRPGTAKTMPEELRVWQKERLAEDLLMDQPAGQVCHQTLPQMDVSSTAVRQLLWSGGDLSDLLIPDVHRYIDAQHLYLEN